MGKDKDLSKLFAKGQQLETSLSTSSIFSKDGGLHLTSYRVVAGDKTTVIDNISIYGSTAVVIESKNYTSLQGTVDKDFWRGRGTSNYFSIPSPLKQNQYHVKILRQYLISKGMKLKDFKILHYIVVPDNCKVEVCSTVRDNLLNQSELKTEKRKLAFYNPTLDDTLASVIKEGLF